MKLLHTADWHLGKRLEHFSRLEEQQAVLEEVIDIAEREQVDAVLIAGDMFDHANPSIEAIELFYRSLKRLADGGRRAVVGIAGNHDSPDRIEAPDPLARACGILLLGYPQSRLQPFELETGLKVLRTDAGFVELGLPGQEVPLRLILTPYSNEVRMKKYLGSNEQQAENLRQLLQAHWQRLANTYCDPAGVNVLMTHLFVVKKGQDTSGLEDEEERSVLTLGGAQEIYTENFPPKLHYAALGHLHSFIEVQTQPYPIIYSSSPLCYSVKDRAKQKYVVLVEAEADQPASYRQISLKSGKPALQQRFEHIDEALQWLQAHPDCLVELTLLLREHLSAQDRKRLLEAHPGILRIIPEFSDPELLRFTSGKQVDLSKDIEALFQDYFLHKKGQPPNQEIMDLFREVLKEEEE